jgi:hypothetical protein
MPDVAVVLVSAVRDSDAASAARLETCLSAIAAQSLKPAQVVLVHDPAGARSARCAASSARVKVEPFAAAGAGAINAAVAGTTAALIALTDDAAVWSAGKLAAQSAAFARPGIDLCGHREEIERDGQKHVVGEFPREAEWPPLLRALRRPLWRPATTMIRRAAFNRLGGLRDGADAGQDFLIRAVRSAAPSCLLELAPAVLAGDPGDWPQPPPDLRATCDAFSAVREHLAALSIEQILGRAPVDARAGELVRGGLALLYDDLEGCHAAAQAVEEPLSNFWHAVMHRRECDFENSKYWWRRVGAHPVFELIAADAGPALKAAVGRDAADLRRRLEKAGGWDPFVFVDFCRACVERRAGKSAVDLARRLQMIEFNRLLEFTVGRALGG